MTTTSKETTGAVARRQIIAGIDNQRRFRRRTKTLVRIINSYIMVLLEIDALKPATPKRILYWVVRAWDRPEPSILLKVDQHPSRGVLYRRLHRVGSRYRDDFDIDTMAFWLAMCEVYDCDHKKVADTSLINNYRQRSKHVFRAFIAG